MLLLRRYPTGWWSLGNIRRSRRMRKTNSMVQKPRGRSMRDGCRVELRLFRARVCECRNVDQQRRPERRGRGQWVPRQIVRTCRTTYMVGWQRHPGLTGSNSLDAKSNHNPGNERDNDDTNNNRHAATIDSRKQETTNQTVDEAVSNLDGEVEDNTEF